MASSDGPRSDQCPFCAIARGSVRVHVVFEDSDVMAFLDIAPIRRGHTQIIPRRHFDFFEQLPVDLAARILTLGQAIARTQKTLYGVDRVAFLFTGGDIAHTHAHLVPIKEKTDITSRMYIEESVLTFRPCPRASEEELARVAAELRDARKEA